jgi:hypothetical protein
MPAPLLPDADTASSEVRFLNLLPHSGICRMPMSITDAAAAEAMLTIAPNHDGSRGRKRPSLSAVTFFNLVGTPSLY